MIITGKYFDFEYSEKDADIANEVLTVAEETYECVATKFSIPKAEYRFNFKLCPDVETYIEATGKSKENYEAWMVGFADYAKRLLCILSPHVVEDRSNDDMMKVIKHEVVHIVFDSLGDPDAAPIGISEGVAVWLADQIETEYLESENYPTMIGLNDEDYFYDNDGYNYSGVYIKFFVEKFGANALKLVYTGEKQLDDYLYHGFEKEAIAKILNCQM